ncbi:hypothetical protein BH24ACT7_BH24ACT7_03730 [soil metagenome]
MARDLLTDSGSVFVQIGDENVHLVRCLLDEVFGSENFVSLITFKKRTSESSDLLGSPPFNPVSDLLSRRPSDFLPEEIGLLTGTLATEDWLTRVRDRFAFLSTPTAEEERLARCNPRDRYTAERAIAGLLEG